MADPDSRRGGGARRLNRWLAAGAILVLAGLLVPLAVRLTRDADEPSADRAVPAGVEDTVRRGDVDPSAPDTAAAPAPERPSIRDDEAGTVVWPDPHGPLRYAEPAEAARSFARGMLGFADPRVGAFRQGDARSGEIPVRPVPEGPETVVLVRLMSDDAWYVLGAVADDIELDLPPAGAEIDTPLRISGRARAFEGRLRARVFARGEEAPIGEGFVTAGGGPEAVAFEGEIAWEHPPRGPGVVVVTSASGEDGGVWQAVAVPVMLGGDP